MTIDFDIERRFLVFRHLFQQENISQQNRLLDLGGYPGTFAQYHSDSLPGLEITTADTIKSEGDQYVHLKIGELPFESDSFDYSMSSDVLEHVPPTARQNFLKEICRVTFNKVIICFPFRNSVSQQIEKELAGNWKEFHGTEHPWLKEHLEYGLPDLEETIRTVSGFGEITLRFAAPMENWMRHQWWSLLHARSDDFSETYGQWNASSIDSVTNNISVELFESPKVPVYRVFLIIDKSKESEFPDSETYQAIVNQNQDPATPGILAESAMMKKMVSLQGRSGGVTGLADEVNRRLEASLHQATSMRPRNMREKLKTIIGK